MKVSVANGQILIQCHPFRIAEGNPSLSNRTTAIQKELNPIKRNVDGVFRFKDLLESFIYSQKKGSKSRPFFVVEFRSRKCGYLIDFHMHYDALGLFFAAIN